MHPTFKNGEIVLVNKLVYRFTKPKLNDIVVVKNSLDLIKRIKKINGKSYFVVGDNLKFSTDSRHFGWISKSQIIGKVYKL